MTDDEALFIACLPDVFCDIDYAIRAHSSSQRVAAVTRQFANNAVRVALNHSFVESDDTGKVRLSVTLQAERDALTELEGVAEMAQAELADLLVARSRGSSGTQHGFYAGAFGTPLSFVQAAIRW